MDAGPIDELTYRRMEKAIRYLDEHVREQPGLGELSRHVGLSEYHLQRVFRRAVGISPKRFLQFLTAERARDLLTDSANLLETAWGAGLSGPGRLHDLMVNVHAMTPAEVRAGGGGVDLRWGVHDTPLGRCVLAASPRGVAVLEFLDDGTRSEGRKRVAARWPEAVAREEPAVTESLAARAFAGSGENEPVSLHLRGTNFQIRVWEALLRVPAGEVVTYGALARSAGLESRSARAVGRAVGANPVAVLIPCHRVIRSTGAAGGYRWGRERKLALLARERAGAEVA
jgi:AraC family transcriptional regulator of adaptative response/methylated-DNA-[protein]-cysteine methyltransferase